jgi:secreted trypsin-like serine protease
MMDAVLLFIVLLFSSINFISTTTYTCDPSILCGCSSATTSVTARIVGGEAAPNHAWGWMISFQRYNQQRCGASLITPEYAVTAAHCVDNVMDQLSILSILAGTNYLNETSSPAQRRSIIKMTMHPDYDPIDYTNDIAILQFSPLAVSTEYNIAFICLPNANQDPFQTDDDLVALGWGVTSETSVQASNYLQQVTVQAFSSTSMDCLQSGLVNASIQFCAGVAGGGKGKCFSCIFNF